MTTEAALAASPSVNTWRRVKRDAEPRNGLSTNSNDKNASIPEDASTTAVSPPVKSSALRKKYRLKTNSGQCHRYSEHEITPINTSGRKLRANFVVESPCSPAQMINPVPRQG